MKSSLPLPFLLLLALVVLAAANKNKNKNNNQNNNQNNKINGGGHGIGSGGNGDNDNDNNNNNNHNNNKHKNNNNNNNNNNHNNNKKNKKNNNGGAGKKQLVLLAGPHKAGASSLEKFFLKHASEYHPNQESAGLDGWVWPSVRPNDLPSDYHNNKDDYRVLDLLVDEHQNHTLQSLLKKSIANAWANATQGVILGTDEFDRIGDTPQDLGLHAMTSVVDGLGLSRDQVTVVLNYRAPRLDQWVSLYKQHATTTTTTTDGIMSYQDYMCEETQQPERWATLHTAMNPLGLALTLLQKTGWKVAVMDTGGVLDAGLDMAHGLACEIINHTTCQDGWVVQTNQNDYQDDNDKEFKDLNDKQKKNLEALFRARDCHYEHRLTQNHRFSTYYQDTLWQDCKKGNKGFFNKMADTDKLLHKIRALTGCHTKDVDLDNTMEGNSDKGDVMSTTSEEPAGSSVENALEDLAEESSMLLHAVGKTNRAASTALLWAIMLLVAGLAGAVQYVFMNQAIAKADQDLIAGHLKLHDAELEEGGGYSDVGGKSSTATVPID